MFSKMKFLGIKIMKSHPGTCKKWTPKCLKVFCASCISETTEQTVMTFYDYFSFYKILR